MVQLYRKSLYMRQELKTVIDQLNSPKVIDVKLGKLNVLDNEIEAFASALVTSKAIVVDFHEATISIPKLADILLKHRKVSPFVLVDDNLIDSITNSNNITNSNKVQEGYNYSEAELSKGLLLLAFSVVQLDEFSLHHQALKKAKNESSAFAFSCINALGSIGWLVMSEYVLGKNYDLEVYIIQALLFGPIFGPLYGISPFSRKKMLAGIVTAELACAATYLASQLVADPKAKVALCIALSISYIMASSKCLSSELLESPGI